MNLNLLPLMMYFEIADIIFMVKCMAPTPYFNISDYVTFCSANTRSSVHLKLKHTKTKTNLLGSSTLQFYFLKWYLLLGSSVWCCRCDQGSVAEYLQEWSVVYCNGEVFASQDKVSCFVQSICHCQCFTFDWSVSGFSSMCESATH